MTTPEAPTRGAAIERIQDLLDPSRAKSARLDAAGFIDVIESEPAPGSIAEALMLTSVLPRIYNRWYRPGFRLARGGLRAVSNREERRLALEMLALEPGDVVYDIASGPGTLTPMYADAIGPEGLAIGVDSARNMLAEAVKRARPNSAFIRADARRLPFQDATADAVVCFAALYLIPEPMKVIEEMVRVAAPGGRVVVLASHAPWGHKAPLLDVAVLKTSGLRAFKRNELTGEFRAHGLVDIRQRVSGFMQFVSGRKPA